MEIPEATAERRVTHKGLAVCRLYIELRNLVKVKVEKIFPGAPVVVGEELQHTKRNWERFEIVQK